MSNQQAHQPLAAVAKTILSDPELLRQVSDRVFELLQEELRNQRDRAGYSRRA